MPCTGLRGAVVCVYSELSSTFDSVENPPLWCCRMQMSTCAGEMACFYSKTSPFFELAGRFASQKENRTNAHCNDG